MLKNCVYKFNVLNINDNTMLRCSKKILREHKYILLSAITFLLFYITFYILKNFYKTNYLKF